MAMDRGYIDLESGRLPIDWATEETLQALLAAMGKSNTGTDNKKRDDDKKHKENKEDNKRTLTTIEKLIKETGISNASRKAVIQELGKKLGNDTKNANKIIRDELKKAGATTLETRAILKGMRDDSRKQNLNENKHYRDLVAATKELKESVAGRAASRAAGAAKTGLGQLNPFGDFSTKAGAAAAGFGAVGAGIGLAMGSIEGFINATNNAVQTGFSFGDQLIETRTAVASVGMSLGEFSELLATNGSSIRRLGDTGMDAQKNFSDLITNVMSASKQFGYFGLTSTETAEMLTPIVDTLAKGGLTQTQIMAEAEQTFMTLNKEVLGLAKLTGRDRREMLRQLDEVRGDDVFQSVLTTLGDQLGQNATSAMDKVTANFASLGPQSGFLLDTFKNLVTESQTNVYALSEEQEAMFQQYPEMRKVFDGMVTQFTTDANGMSADVGAHMQTLIDTAAGYESQAAQNVLVHAKHGSTAIANSSTAMVSLARDTQNLADGGFDLNTATENLMSENDKALLATQQNIKVIMNTLQAQVLKLFAVENVEALGKEGVMEGVTDKINAFGDSLVKFRDYLFSLSENLTDVYDWVGGFFMSEEELANQPDMSKVLVSIAGLFGLAVVVGSAVTSIAGLFAAKAVVGALSGAIGLLFGGAKLPKAPKLPTKTPTGPNPQAGMPKGKTTGSIAKALGVAGKAGKAAGKALPWVAALQTAFSAYQGYMDKDLTDAGYAGVDRAAIGITEDLAKTFDFLQNALGKGANYALGTEFRTDYDLAGAFRETMLDPAVAEVMMNPLKAFGNWFTSSGEDTGVMAGYENMTPIEAQNAAAALNTPGAAVPLAAPVVAETTPAIDTTAVEEAAQAQYQATQQLLSNTNPDVKANALSALGMNAQANTGITKSQADEMLRYLKMTAENTDQ